MPDTFQLEIVTPEKKVVDTAATEVQIPGKNGYLGVLPGHAPLITELAVGEITYRAGAEEQKLAVAWGFAEVLPDKVTILAETAERPSEIDVDRARKAKERAEQRLTSGDTNVDVERSLNALHKAETRLEVAGKNSSRHSDFSTCVGDMECDILQLSSSSSLSVRSSQLSALLKQIKPSSPASPPAPLVSPEVHADGSVTFRFRAPNAKEVELAREGAEPQAMQKDDQGVWSLTTAPLAPDYYGYSFVADGVRLIDPSNPAAHAESAAPPQAPCMFPVRHRLPWEVNDVPHGEIHHHFYKSSVAGDERDYYVYTPPGYDAARKRRYPVLYLLHGYQ